MRKTGYMFTNKRHSGKGMASAFLGCLDLVYLFLVILFCFQAKGNASARDAAVTMFALVFSLIGFVIGILSRIEKDRFYLFPDIGIATNFIVIVLIVYMLVLGVS